MCGLSSSLSPPSWSRCFGKPTPTSMPANPLLWCKSFNLLLERSGASPNDWGKISLIYWVHRRTLQIMEECDREDLPPSRHRYLRRLTKPPLLTILLPRYLHLYQPYCSPHAVVTSTGVSLPGACKFEAGVNVTTSGPSS